MAMQWKSGHRQPRSGSPGQDKLKHVAVGDPDPTSNPGTASRSRKCGFQWDESSQTLVLWWTCTRERGHQGQHLAGTGEWVAAVHPPVLATGDGYQRLGVITPQHPQRNGQPVPRWQQHTSRHIQAPRWNIPWPALSVGRLVRVPAMQSRLTAGRRAR
jgi:hypothetical protein